MDLTILGGGPAGLATAFYAHREGLRFRLFELADRTGGLCQTRRCGDHRYDTGAHRFHDRYPDITEDLQGLLGDSLHRVSSPSKVLTGGRLFDFPPTPINAILSSGLWESGRVALDLLKSRIRRRPVNSFADYAESRFGHRLARRFLINYSEKVWGLPAERLSPEVATRRLSGMSLSSFLVELLRPSRKTAHIDGQFLYPRQGYGQICDSLQRTLPSAAVHTGHRVTGFQVRGRRITELAFESQGSMPVSECLVSTLPLTKVVSFLGPALPRRACKAARQLRFRHVRLVFLRLSRSEVSPWATIYLPDAEFCISRVHEPQNRSSSLAPRDETALVAEVPCFEDDLIATVSPSELVSKVISELETAGLLNPDEIIEWRHHWLRNAYPVYSRDYEVQVQAVMDGLSRFENLHLVGRQGRFFYSHLHHQMRFGKELVRKLRSVKLRFR